MGTTAQASADDAPWLAEAIGQIGVAEVPGAGSNPLIVEWGRRAGIAWWAKDSDAWCAVFVNAMLVAAGYPSTASALAKSFLDYGRRLGAPVRGAIVVFPRGAPTSIYGHVGIVETVNGDGTITVVNGNVDDRVKRSVYRIDAILPAGIRWPAEAVAPANDSGRALGVRMLRGGETGADVAELQRLLGVLGHTLAPTGIYDAQTIAAVRSHQAINALAVDGIAGPATISSLVAKAESRAAAQAKTQAASKAAVPAAAAGGGAVATIGAGIEVARQLSSLNDGTPIGALLVLVALAAIGGFLAWRFWPRRDGGLRRTRSGEAAA